MPRKKTVEIETPVFNSENVVTEINWIDKSKRGWSKYDNGRKDVYVAINKHNADDKNKTPYTTLGFSFRDGIEKTITSTKYIQFGVCKNRIYFKEADSQVGYRVTKKGGTTAAMGLHIGDSYAKDFEMFNHGEFHLKYDDFQELYYIEVEAE